MKFREGYRSQKEFETAPQSHDFFRVLFENKENIPVDNISIDLVEPGSTIRRTEESEACIDDQWNRLIKEHKIKPWPNDTKPTRFRFVDCILQDGNVNLTLDPCVSYRDFVGSRDPDFLKRFGQDFLPNPLSGNMLVVTADERLVLTVRGHINDYKAGGYQFVAGGFMNMGIDNHPMDTAIREVAEETGIQKNEYMEDVSFLGIATSDWTYATDSFFLGHTTLSSSEIDRRDNDNENTLLYIPFDIKKIQQWILAPVHACSPTTIAAILMACKKLLPFENMNANEWESMMLRALHWRSRGYDDPKKRAKLEAEHFKRFERMFGHNSKK